MSNEIREVVVTDVKIPFRSMVTLTVDWAIAAIPAVILVYQKKRGRFVCNLTV